MILQIIRLRLFSMKIVFIFFNYRFVRFKSLRSSIIMSSTENVQMITRKSSTPKKTKNIQLNHSLMNNFHLTSPLINKMQIIIFILSLRLK